MRALFSSSSTESPPYRDKLTSATENDFHHYDWSTLCPGIYSLEFSCLYSNLCNGCWFHWDSDGLGPETLRIICQNIIITISLGPNSYSAWNCMSAKWSQLVFASLSLFPFRVFCQCEIKIFFLLSPRLWIRSPLVNHLDTDLPKTKNSFYK